MDMVQIGGREYPILDIVKTKDGREVPLVDIPMMSDFKWQLTSLEDRLADSVKYVETLDENVEDTVTKLFHWIVENLKDATEDEKERFNQVMASLSLRK